MQNMKNKELRELLFQQYIRGSLQKKYPNIFLNFTIYSRTTLLSHNIVTPSGSIYLFFYVITVVSDRLTPLWNKILYASTVKFNTCALQPLFRCLYKWLIIWKVCPTHPILQAPEKMEVWWCQIGTVWRMGQHSPTECRDRFHYSQTGVWPCIVMLQQNVVHPPVWSNMTYTCMKFLQYSDICLGIDSGSFCPLG